MHDNFLYFSVYQVSSNASHSKATCEILRIKTYLINEDSHIDIQYTDFQHHNFRNSEAMKTILHLLLYYDTIYNIKAV